MEISTGKFVNKIKLLHIITGLNTGGAEMMLFKLVAGMGQQFEIKVVSLTNKGEIGKKIEVLGVPVVALGMKKTLTSLSYLKKIKQLTPNFQPDIIQGWMYHGNLAASLMRLFSPFRPALVWNIRHSLYNLHEEKRLTQLIIRASRFFSATPDVLLYNSNISQKQHQDFGFAPMNGQVIPNGTDIQQFCFSVKDRNVIRSKLNIPSEAKVIGHVARLHPMKDHQGFLRVSAKLALRHENVYFLLIGWHVSQEHTNFLKLIPEQVRDRFHLLGECDNISELMSAMDIFCVSSAWGEGFPNVIGEAMATGIPCVATDVGDSAILVDNTGVIVPPRDEKALTDGINSLLTMPSEAFRILGVNACARIEANYTIEAIVKQYTAVYQNLLTKKEMN